ncbi:MAG: MFS transporter [Clostridia bacterium]|nr:MFS transporter [Clostridia bacterium]
MLHKSNEKSRFERNLKLIVWETILSSIGAGFSVPIMTVFWNSIGMSQTDIGFTQMMFTIVMVALDIPMGYIADRFNRKALNVIGDVGVALAFLLYAFSKNMYMAILSEILLGFFMAMTNGVDQSFIKYNCNKIDPSGELFKKKNLAIFTARYISLLIVVILGGFIAKINLRLAIGASFVPYIIGGIMAIGIKDFDNNISVRHKNPVKDMLINIREIVKDSKVKTYLFSYILGKEVTHAQIWIFTPLLMIVGVPMEIVSLGWVINYVMQIVGSKISEKTIHLKNKYKFAIPMLMEFLWIAIIVINTNIVTVWLFALNGFVHGFIEGSLVTPLQESTRDEVQTSVLSIASTGARLLYVPLVYIINYLGNINLQLGLIGIIIIFLPMSIFAYIKLCKIEKSEEILLLGDSNDRLQFAESGEE